MAQPVTRPSAGGPCGHSGYGSYRQKPEARGVRHQELLSRRPTGTPGTPTPREVVVISLHARSPSPVNHRVARVSTTMTTPVQVRREARTAPSTPAQTYRMVSSGTPATPHQCTPRSRLGVPVGRGLASARKPLVLPAWPSVAAWTTYQPGGSGTGNTTVERRTSAAERQPSASTAVTATSIGYVERQVSTASERTSMLSHARSLSSSSRFSPTLAWSPRTLASSFHVTPASPRVQRYVLKPCSSFPSAPRGPPVVRIDLTEAHAKPAQAKASFVARSGRELDRALSPREAKKILPEPRSKAEGSDDSDEESDEVKELSHELWAMARHREDGRMPSAERQLFGRLPGTVVL